MLNKKWIKVNPVIVIPECIKNGKKQDCFNCELKKQNLCESPRSWCTNSYEEHKNGCPNYGKRKLCPPECPLFTEIYDINKDVYAIIYKYKIEDINKKELIKEIYENSEKEHKKIIEEFLKENNNEKYEIISPEAMGVDVNKTLEKVGIKLQWPPKDIVLMVALAAVPLKNKSIKQYCNDNTLTCYYKK